MVLLIDFWLTNRADLVGGEIRKCVGGPQRTRFFHHQRRGLLWFDLQTKPHPARGSFGGPVFAAQLVAGPDRMLHDEGSRRAVFVAEGVGFFFADFAFVGHHAAAWIRTLEMRCASFVLRELTLRARSVA